MKKIKQNKLAGKIATMEKGKSQSKVGDVNQIIKIIKHLIKEEVIAFQKGEKKSLPVTNLLLSEAMKGLKKLNAKTK